MNRIERSTVKSYSSILVHATQECPIILTRQWKNLFYHPFSLTKQPPPKYCLTILPYETSNFPSTCICGGRCPGLPFSATLDGHNTCCSDWTPCCLDHLEGS